MTDNQIQPPAPPQPLIDKGTLIQLRLKTALMIAISTFLAVTGVARFFYTEIKEDIAYLHQKIDSKVTVIAARVKTLENGADQKVAVSDYTPGSDTTALQAGINLLDLGWTVSRSPTDPITLPWANIPSADPTAPVSATPPSIYCQSPVDISADGTDNGADVCLVLRDPASAIGQIDSLGTSLGTLSPPVEDLRDILGQGWDDMQQ